MKKDDNFIMLPTVDFCFKELMQDAKIREGFIAALLGVAPVEVRETTLLPTILEGEFPEEKQSILDVRVALCDGTQMDMEMQVAYCKYWKSRTVYYLGKMYVGQLIKGNPYGKLERCYHVSILDFILFPNDERCYRTISFRDNETNEQYSDLMEIKILELRKLPKELPACNGSVYDWMRFFSGKTRKEFEKMAAEYEYFDAAYNKLVKLSADDVKRLEYENRERNIRDFKSWMEGSYEDGEEHGREEGRAEGSKEALLQNIKGLMKTTGWSAEEAMDKMQVSERDREEVRPLL